MPLMTSTGAQDTQPFHLSTKKEKEVLVFIFVARFCSHVGCKM